MVEAKAKLNHVSISSKKIRLVADAIRGLDVAVALHRLPVMFKKSAPVVEKLLKSAVANAVNKYEVKPEDLFVKAIMVDKAMDLKRWRPAAFGSAHPLRKRSAHISITVATKEGVEVKAKDKKEVAVETVDLTKMDKKSATKTTVVKSGSKASAKIKDAVKKLNTESKKPDNSKVKKP